MEAHATEPVSAYKRRQSYHARRAILPARRRLLRREQGGRAQCPRACFDQWQAVSNSHLRFEEGGVMPGKLDVNTADNTNVVFWAKDSTIVDGGFDNISGATGVTFSD